MSRRRQIQHEVLAYAALFPGQYTVQQLAAQIGCKAADVYVANCRLRKKGLLIPGAMPQATQAGVQHYEAKAGALPLVQRAAG